MITVADLESDIYKGPLFAPSSGHLASSVLSASETVLPLVMKLRRNVVMMCAGDK